MHSNCYQKGGLNTIPLISKAAEPLLFEKSQLAIYTFTCAQHPSDKTHQIYSFVSMSVKNRAFLLSPVSHFTEILLKNELYSKMLQLKQDKRAAIPV